MKVEATKLEGVLKLQPTVHGDARGWFMEAFNARRFAEATGHGAPLVQDNQSLSARGVLRGLHYQVGPNAQAKLVRVLAGEIFDVAVDLRRASPTFGRWTGAWLSAHNRTQLWVPVGFAHGFVVTSEQAEVLYKVSAPYDRAAERAVRWDDPGIGIDWPLEGAPTLSDKDAVAPALEQAEVFEAAA